MQQQTRRRFVALALVVAFAALPAAIAGQSVPKPIKSRFVLGEPIWRELPVRAQVATEYDRCWQTVLDSLLQNKFDLAQMDKPSGYVRTTWNEGIISLGSDWEYRVQVTVKLVMQFGDSADAKATVAKVRIQVAGELANVSKGVRTVTFRGYDQVILQDLFQDLQAKLG